MGNRVLVVSDSAKISSGFGRVVREVFTRLHATKKYEIAQHGWFDHLGIHSVPFKIFPTKVLPSGMPDPKDAYGSLSFDSVVDSFKPDVVIGIGDPPFLKSITNCPIRHRFKLIFYMPIDGFPLAASWKNVLEFPDKLILFGNWPIELAKAQFGLTCTDYIYHGVDTSVYYPGTEDEIHKIKATNLKDTDSFIFGFMGRNSERKKLDQVIQAVSIIKHGTYGYCTDCKRYAIDPINNVGQVVNNNFCRYCKGTKFSRAIPRKVKLLLHVPVNDTAGPKLDAMVNSFNMNGSVYIDPTYKVTQGVSDKELRKMFIAMDCFVSFAMEGFGLTTLEAMACGLPLIMGDYSAHPEWCKDASILIPAASWITEQRSSLLRPLPDLEAFVAAALRIIQDKETRERLSKAGRTKALSMDWNVIAKQWETVIDAQLAVPVNKYAKI